MSGRLKSISDLTLSESTRRRNPHLLTSRPVDVTHMAPHVRAAVLEEENGPVKPKARLRQNSKPLLNSNEQAFLAHLEAIEAPGAFTHAQAITLRLANGVRYTPDFVTFEPMTSGLLRFWEVKGLRKIFDGAGEKLKIAAAHYPEFIFTIVWRDQRGEWQQQRIHS